MYTRSLFAALLLLIAFTAQASPPLRGDISLQLSVESESPAPYPQGARGELTLTVMRIEGPVSHFHITTGLTPVSLDAPAPVRFNADDCDLQEVTDHPDIEGRFWFVFGGFDSEGRWTCRISFDVLEQVDHGESRLRFHARPVDLGSAGFIDTNPDNNFADFVLGRGSQPPVPVPGLTSLTWLLSLVAGILLVAGFFMTMRGA